MLLETNVVGKKIDWADYVTLSDEHDTPMLKRIPKGQKPVNVTKHYQADVYEEPSSGSWPDGKEWSTFSTAGAQRGELNARVQFMVETAAVSKLAQDVTNTAGVKDELGREVVKKMTVISRRFECAAGCDQSSVADNGQQGHFWRGMGKWIRSTAQSDADKDVPANLLTPAASIYSDTKANWTEDTFRTVLQSMWTKTGKKGNMWMPVGFSLKRALDLFQFYIPTSASTQSTARVTTREAGDTLSNKIDYYDSDFGTVEIEISKWLQYYGGSAASAFGGSTTTTVGAWRGYILHPDMWEFNWNQKPTTYKPEYKGGSYRAAIEAILMLLCKNPIGEGKVDPSDA